MFILFLLVSSHPEHLPAAVKISREDDCGPVVFVWCKLCIAPLNLCWTDIAATIVHDVFVFSGSVKVRTNWRSCSSVFRDRSKWRNRCFVHACTGFWNHLCNICLHRSILCFSESFLISPLSFLYRRCLGTLSCSVFKYL